MQGSHNESKHSEMGPVRQNPIQRPVSVKIMINKSSAVAEMGDRGHNRHGRKRGGYSAPFVESWGPV